jgi:class 3 adenylate cyclase
VGARDERDPKLAAILVADVVGHSRLASADEDRILARLRTLRSDLIDPTVADDEESVALDTFDLQPVLATTRAIRQIDAFRDDALKFVRAGELEEFRAVALEFLAEQDRATLRLADQLLKGLAALAQRKLAQIAAVEKRRSKA